MEVIKISFHLFAIFAFMVSFTCTVAFSDWHINEGADVGGELLISLIALGIAFVMVLIGGSYGN